MTLDYTFERWLELQQEAVEEAQAALREARKEAEAAQATAEEAHSAGQEDQLWSLIQKETAEGKDSGTDSG